MNAALSYHEATDLLLDYSADIIDTPAKARRRDRNFEKLAAGDIGCEVCGRKLDTAKATNWHGHHIGPTCTKKLVKLGFDFNA